MSYIKQADSGGGGGDISGSGSANQVAFFNGTKTITSDSDFTVNSTSGRLSVTGGVNIPTGSAAAPALAITGDTDTGVFSAGANQIGFTVAGSDALGVGPNKNVTVGGASGTGGQVLTSGGSGGATTWTSIASGSSQISHTPQLAVDLFGASSSLVTVYPLLASGQSAQTTTSDLWNDSVSTTTLFLWPCIAAKTGTINGLQLRTGATAGDDLHFGLYKANGITGLPDGAPAFSTSITPATNTSYTPTISVTGVSKGDILYFGTFGQSTRTNLQAIDVSDGGTFVVGRGVSSVNFTSGGSYQNVQLSGQTNGVFPTLSASTQYTGSGQPDYVARIGITYS